MSDLIERQKERDAYPRFSLQSLPESNDLSVIDIRGYSGGKDDVFRIIAESIKKDPDFLSKKGKEIGIELTGSCAMNLEKSDSPQINLSVRSSRPISPDEKRDFLAKLSQPLLEEKQD